MDALGVAQSRSCEMRKIVPVAAISITPPTNLQVGWSEPGSQRVGEPLLRPVSHPRHISVRPNQNGSRSSDRPDCRKLPRAIVFGVDGLNPIRPPSDVEAPRLTEVDEHRPGIVQQRED